MRPPNASTAFRNSAGRSCGDSPLSAASLDLNRSTLTCHSGCMANGQVVLITTEQLGERPVTRTVYYVAEEDAVKATAIIAAVMAPNETVVAYGPLPDAAVKAMGLTPGEFRRAGQDAP